MVGISMMFPQGIRAESEGRDRAVALRWSRELLSVFSNGHGESRNGAVETTFYMQLPMHGA